MSNSAFRVSEVVSEVIRIRVLKIKEEHVFVPQT